MQEPPPVNTLVAELQQFASQLERLLSAPGVDWVKSRGKDEWSVTEVVCHLRDVEREVHLARLEALSAAPCAFLPGAVADAWVHERAYREQDGPEALAAFLSARAETVGRLQEFDAKMWQRKGQHAFFGPTTIHELVYLMVQHDQAHWEQINSLLAPEENELIQCGC